MTEMQAWLDQGRELANQATEGPWIAEFSRETGDCVVPHDAQSTREAVATTRLIHAPADAAFIADARTRLPQALNKIQAVLNLHKLDPDDSIPSCSHCLDEWENTAGWPCPTVRAIMDAIGDHQQP